MPKYSNGTEFYNYNIENKCIVVGYNETYDRYFVSSQKHNATELWNESDIDKVMAKQELIISNAQKAKEAEDLETKRKQVDIESYNNVDRFCDNMTALQRGKALVALNRTIQYQGQLMTKKDFVKQVLDSGYTPAIKKNVTIDKRAPKDYYVLQCAENGSFFEVSKTEHDYAVYLKSN